MPRFSRRGFIFTALATVSAASMIRRAEARTAWTMPADWTPHMVLLNNSYSAGQVHVVPSDFALYLTFGGQSARRYKVGIGKGDLYESGNFWIGAKKEWPSWKPTAEMVERNPAAYSKWAEEPMPGGPKNPLGARALYLFAPNAGDTMLRIHGTPDPWTVGTAVSNGCVRLMNEHIEELYNLVPVGAPVVLYPKDIVPTV